jgi:integrase
MPIGKEGWVSYKSGKWLGHYTIYIEDSTNPKGFRRTQGSQVVASKSDTTKRTAKQMNQVLIKKMLGKGPNPFGTRITFGEYVEKVFIPMRRVGWKVTTEGSNLYVINHYIVEHFGGELLDQIDEVQIATFLKGLAQKYAHGVVQKIYTNLRAIFRRAYEMEYLPKDPAKTIKQPKAPCHLKKILTGEQLRDLLNGLEDPEDKCILATGAFCALRTAEVFGLTWSAWEGDQITPSSTAFKGVLYRDNAKTPGSKASIPLSEVARPWVEEWYAVCPDTAPDDMMYSYMPRWGRFKGKTIPRDPYHWWRKHVWPVALRLGIPVELLTFQVTRRTAATLAFEHGSVKDVQEFLRHADPRTTLKYYVQPVAESTRRTVNNWANSVMTQEVPPQTAAQPTLAWTNPGIQSAAEQSDSPAANAENAVSLSPMGNHPYVIKAS